MVDSIIIIIIIIMYIYDTLINACVILVNLNTILYVRRGQSYQNKLHKALYGNTDRQADTHTQTHTHTHTHSHMRLSTP